jgi:hypothetical protein
LTFAQTSLVVSAKAGIQDLDAGARRHDIYFNSISSSAFPKIFFRVPDASMQARVRMMHALRHSSPISGIILRERSVQDDNQQGRPA